MKFEVAYSRGFFPSPVGGFKYPSVEPRWVGITSRECLIVTAQTGQTYFHVHICASTYAWPIYIYIYTYNTIYVLYIYPDIQYPLVN